MFTGPSIVTDGMVLSLDAANTKSYVSGSTVWRDMSGNNYSGSLINGPTFNSNNGGRIVFDGTNDYINLNNRGSILATDNFTIEVWCIPTSTIANITEATTGIAGTSGQRYITEPGIGSGTTAGAGVSIGTNGITVFEHAPSYMPGLLEYTATIPNTTFSHIVVTYTSKQPRAYLNTVLVRTGLTSTKSAVNLISGEIGGMAYGYFAGSLANVKYYNRSLTASEVFQNYNAQKSRFGL
jgi:hypothetical protein